MNDQLLAQAMELLAEAEISYTSNGHFYEPEIIDELRSISDQINRLNDRLKQSYAVIEIREIIGETAFEKIRDKEVQGAKDMETIEELFDSIDSGDFICPGGPLTNFIPYDQLKRIFKDNVNITIEEAKKRIRND